MICGIIRVAMSGARSSLLMYEFGYFACIFIHEYNNK